jgi:hypothetical protein
VRKEQRPGIPPATSGHHCEACQPVALQGAPRPPISSLIRVANNSGVPILALDIPSGLDGDRGTPHDPCITATSALTLALPNIGLLQSPAAGTVGELYLADISVPASVYDRLGIAVETVFARDDVGRSGDGYPRPGRGSPPGEQPEAHRTTRRSSARPAPGHPTLRSPRSPKSAQAAIPQLSPKDDNRRKTCSWTAERRS